MQENRHDSCTCNLLDWCIIKWIRICWCDVKSDLKSWSLFIWLLHLIGWTYLGSISWLSFDTPARTPLPIYFLSFEPFFFESPLLSFLLFLLFTKNTPIPTPMTKNRTRLHGVQLNRDSRDGSGWHTRRTSARLQQGMIVSKDALLVLQNSALPRI